MAALDQLQNDPKAALWNALSEETAVMLGIDGVTDFMKPMAAKPDLNSEIIWFFTDKRSDTFGRLSGEPAARICISDSTEHFWADIKGRIKVVKDSEVVANKWSVDIEAWYDKGKRDDNLQLMAFSPEKAELSASTANPISFSWQTAKAILGNQDRPDISKQKQITFS